MRALVIALTLATSLAHADSSDARAHFAAGSRAYNLGDWQRAISEYKKAYDVSPDPAFLYNIGQAYRGAGDARQALFFYRSYLRNAPDASNRGEVEQRIAKLQAEVDRENQLAPTPPPTATPNGSANTLTAAPSPPPPTPAYKKWWLWTSVAVVAVGAGLGLGLGLGLSPSAPSSHFGTHNVF